ncbi:MAG: 4-alpha-glucanotransferase [Candidatus Theseobacter exili]|nr:4-alpha-glucanotransferase [Candidatus Theseobacter exili]
MSSFRDLLGQNKTSFILFHITSLPDPPDVSYGIGELGSEAFKFIDFLTDSGTKVWQILPFGHTGYKSSPYQTFSRFAGSPYLVSIEKLYLSGDINKEQHDVYSANVKKTIINDNFVDFGWLFRNKIGSAGRIIQRFYG